MEVVVEMKTRHMYFPSELKVRSQTEEDQTQAPMIEGYFAVFNQETELWQGMFEEIAPGAFDNSLADNDIRCLFDHDSAIVLGRSAAGTLALTVDERGLYGKVMINQDDTEAMNIYQRVKRGDISGCSFGFDPIDEELINRDDGTVKFIVKEADTLEVSIVTFPAYPQTEIEARKADVNKMTKRRLQAKKNNLKERMKKWH